MGTSSIRRALTPAYASLLALSVQLSGCGVVKGIFKLGVWAGVAIAVVAVLAVAAGASFFRRRG